LLAHRHAPSKEPQIRLQQLQWAGELRIPFTTGLLLGVGETEADWVESLQAIAQLHRTHGHIQEVILQPHSPGETQVWGGEPFDVEKLVAVVAIARQILPQDIALQIPPNLVNPEALLTCLTAGATDLGGIGPKDEVNPNYPHPQDEKLAALLQSGGWPLQPRLPIYPQYDSWLTDDLKIRVKRWRQQLAELPSQTAHLDTNQIDGGPEANHLSTQPRSSLGSAV
jgi:7,8-didemethyl-8-hydroxy-5-deazariboflavin synthase